MRRVPWLRGPAASFRRSARLFWRIPLILLLFVAGNIEILAEPTPESAPPKADPPAAPPVAEQPAAPPVAEPPASPPVADQPAAKTPLLMMGLLVHDPGGLWSRAKSEAGADANLEVIFAHPARTIWKGILSPNAGLTLNSQGDTAKIYGGALYELENSDGVFVNTGLGLALHNGRLRTTDPHRKQLGSRLLFHIPIEAGFTFANQKRFSLFFDHISNGYSFHPNEGLDTIGFRIGVPF